MGAVWARAKLTDSHRQLRGGFSAVLRAALWAVWERVVPRRSCCRSWCRAVDLGPRAAAPSRCWDRCRPVRRRRAQRARRRRARGWRVRWGFGSCRSPTKSELKSTSGRSERLDAAEGYIRPDAPHPNCPPAAAPRILDPYGCHGRRRVVRLLRRAQGSWAPGGCAIGGVNGGGCYFAAKRSKTCDHHPQVGTYKGTQSSSLVTVPPSCLRNWRSGTALFVLKHNCTTPSSVTGRTGPRPRTGWNASRHA